MFLISTLCWDYGFFHRLQWAMALPIRQRHVHTASTLTPPYPTSLEPQLRKLSSTVCVIGTWVGVTSTPEAYNFYTVKLGAPERIILGTFPFRCSYSPGRSTSLFTSPVGQRDHPLNILNIFLP